jgi:hypothetical protein
MKDYYHHLIKPQIFADDADERLLPHLIKPQIFAEDADERLPPIS